MRELKSEDGLIANCSFLFTDVGVGQINHQYIIGDVFWTLFRA